MASTWWRVFRGPLLYSLRKTSCCGRLEPSLPPSSSAIRQLSITAPLQKQRKKFDLYPDGVPSWANYDGNRKCIDGDAGDRLIWEGYKRNFKGQRPPQKTRLRCIRGHRVCGNPCPICSRGLTVEYTNIDLLSQFVCPQSNAILPATRTGLCRFQQKKIESAIEKARDHGLLDFTVPRKFPEEELRTPLWNKIDIR